MRSKVQETRTCSGPAAPSRYVERRQGQVGQLNSVFVSHHSGLPAKCRFKRQRRERGQTCIASPNTMKLKFRLRMEKYG